VRPAGRALSVHQGKGATAIAAKIGACCEAIESHCAENAVADGPLCRFEALPERERAPALSDFARTRGDPPADEPIRWSRAEDPLGGGTLWLPHDFVSLDLARRGTARIERSSAGLGLGGGLDRATEVALLEAVERDCVGEWQRRPLGKRFEALVDPRTIPYDWFGEWSERLAALGMDIACFAPPAVVDVPAAICWIGGAGRFDGGYRSFSGSACHPDPEQALFKALAEALQSRLTFIAGVRDDILPSHYAGRSSPVPAAASAEPGRAWDRVRPALNGWRPLAERLAGAGYGRVGVKRLDSELEGAAVVKAFVPGLGSLRRTRRAPR
jgi:ribosomal protein S12 methylthiotransferase accessory factor